jgi:hypothetical protein
MTSQLRVPASIATLEQNDAAVSGTNRHAAEQAAD